MTKPRCGFADHTKFTKNGAGEACDEPLCGGMA